jgi:magnesium chelatase family protein
LESLREPLEAGVITISRAGYQLSYPANFQLITAMNPCPCGHAGNAAENCHCTEQQIQRYNAKLSGPLLDRIDMHVEVPALPAELLTTGTEGVTGEASAVIKQRVINSRDQQNARQQKCNAELTVGELELYCQLDTAAQQTLTQFMQKYKISARVYHRTVKLARTIADLAGLETITIDHVREALAYRCRDRVKEYS